MPDPCDLRGIEIAERQCEFQNQESNHARIEGGHLFRKQEDQAHKHVEQILAIASLFNIPGVSHDAVMLRIFPITLTRAAKRWMDRLSPRTANSWDLLKKAFIQRYCVPSKTAKQLEESATSSRKVTKHYTKLGNWANSGHDTCSSILTAIQTIADQSQKWHDGSSSRNIDSSSNSEGIIAISTYFKANTLPNNNRNDGRFNRGASGYDQPSSGERRPSLNEIMNKYMEEAAKRHAEQDEWLKNFYQNTRTNRETHDKIIQDLETKVRILTNEIEGRANGGKFKECKTICTEDGSPLYTPFYYSPEEIEYFYANSGFFDNERQETDKSGMTKARATLEATFEIKNVPQEEKQSVNYYVDPYDLPIPFPR
ncbi:hypothetical protein Tco_0973239 [Tanacetum coccineum]